MFGASKGKNRAKELKNGVVLPGVRIDLGSYRLKAVPVSLPISSHRTRELSSSHRTKQYPNRDETTASKNQTQE